MSKRKTKRIDGYGVVLGSVSFGDTARGSCDSRGWWDVYDANGRRLRRIAATDDREREGRLFAAGLAVTPEDVLALARTVFPSAIRVVDADLMMDAGVIEPDGTMGYVILG